MFECDMFRASEQACKGSQSSGVKGRTALHTAALARIGGVRRQLPGLTTTAVDQVQCMHDIKGG